MHPAMQDAMMQLQRMASLVALHCMGMPDGVVLSCPVPAPSGSSQVRLHHAGSVLPPPAPPAIGSVATHGPQPRPWLHPKTKKFSKFSITSNLSVHA